MERRKLFTREEANAILPRVEFAMTRLQRAALRLCDEKDAYARGRGLAPGEYIPTEDLLRHRPAARAIVEELDSAVHEIEASGAELKDAQLGLVDFPTRLDGEIAYLCWQFGEPEVAYWHRLGDGFAGRLALPGAPRVPQVQ